MNYRTASWETRARASSSIDLRVACVILLVGCSMAMVGQTPSGTKSPGSVIKATHILGLEGASNDASGTLSVEGTALQFQKSGGPTAQVSVTSIQDVLTGVEDRQVGGTPLALGRAAAPFGGGRVVGLFSHKKYDTLTLEYLDANGGFHGAIFLLAKGQGEVLKSQLIAGGAHVSHTEDQPAAQTNPEVKK